MKRFEMFFVVMFAVSILSGNLFANRTEANRNMQTLLNNHVRNPQYSSIKIVGAVNYWRAKSTESKTFNVDLQVGKRYIFLASGDRQTLDMDVYISDQNGMIVAFDDVTPVRTGGPGADAACWYAPIQSGRYAVKVVTYRTNGNQPATCCYALTEF